MGFLQGIAMWYLRAIKTGYLQVIADIYKMRQTKQGLEFYKDMISTAHFFAQPEASKTRHGKHGWEFDWNGKRLYIEGLPIYMHETFFQEQYRCLDVKGKTVIDMGCASGDTPIYFSLRGASKVLAYDIDEFRVEQAKRNMQQNGITNVELSTKCLKRLPNIRGAVVKIDVEGYEHELIPKSDMSIYTEVMLEYHGKKGELPEILHKAGFELQINGAEDLGFIYAHR